LYTKDTVADTMKRYNLSASDGFFWRAEGQIAVPNVGNLRSEIIEAFHASTTAGHFGRDKTGIAVSQHYWWPTHTIDIDDWVRRCPNCQINKPHHRRPAGLLQPLPVPENTWDSVSVDFITHLPLTARGHDAIMVVVDRLSKMAHFIPTGTTATVEEIAYLFYTHVWLKHGISLEIVSDRDSKFTSHTWERLCELWSLSRKKTTAFHPPTYGQTERTNRTLEQMLRMYVSPNMSDWDLYLGPTKFAYNNTPFYWTGYTPFYLNYGRDPRVPAALIRRRRGDAGEVLGIENFVSRMDDLVATAKRNIVEAQARQKLYADPKNPQKQPVFAIGEEVLLNSKNLRFKDVGARKLLPKFFGPFKVTAQIGNVAYRLALPPEIKIHPVFHVNLLRKYYPGVQPKPPPWQWLADQELHNGVERLLAHRESTRGSLVVKEYLVQWKGGTRENASWVLESRTPHDLISEYWERRSLEDSNIRGKVMEPPLTSYLRRSRRLLGLPTTDDSTVARTSRVLTVQADSSPRRGGVVAVMGANAGHAFLAILAQCALHPAVALPD